MKLTKESEILKDIIQIGSEISGGITSAIIERMIPGMQGAIFGGVTGAVISQTFLTLGSEINQRVLGKREEIKIGAAFGFAIKQIQENIDTGKNVRQDDFFQAAKENRSTAEEILEGVLLTVQKSHQEKKIKFLGYLYSNIVFDDTVDREMANHLIKLGESLSFRQYCFIAIYYNKKKYIGEREVNMTKDVYSIIRIDAMSELYNLENKALISIRNPFLSGGGRTLQVPPEYVSIQWLGERLYELMNLKEIEDDDILMSGKYFGISKR